MERPVATNGMRATGGIYIGLFFITLATLLFEVLLTRIYSVATWYHFAFVAVSIALFGMTAGALTVHLLPDQFRADQVRARLRLFSLLFAISVVVCFMIQLCVPFLDNTSVVQLFSLSVIYFVTAIPFFCSGVCVSLVLTRFPDRVGSLYAVDLIGAALGSISLIWLLNRFDGVTAVFVVAVIGGISAICFAFDAGGVRAVRLSSITTVALILLVAMNAVTGTDGQPAVHMIWVKGKQDVPHLDQYWNAYSRVTIDGNPDRKGFPFGWGMSRTLSPTTRAQELNLVIDGQASTVLTHFDGDFSKVDYLKYDITNFAHYLRSNADVFIVGSGGGRDVLSALTFHQRSATAAEINNRILHAVNGKYGAFTGHLNRYPNVRFVNDEARSWLAHSKQRFGIVQMSLIDTWAASSAGAFALTENSLYTVEAWKNFYEHLDNNGILTVSRWYFEQKPLEVYRMISLANKMLRDEGVQSPRDHMLLLKTPARLTPGLSVATLLISRQPFSPAVMANANRDAANLRFITVLSPTQALDHNFDALASAANDHQLNRAVNAIPGDVSASSDNRPFFFLMLGFRDVFNHSLSQHYFFGNIDRPVQVLFGLTVVSLLATLLLILIPLRLSRKRIPRGTAPFIVYFAAIGLGFLLIELSQLQRLVVFLGHPTRALSVVLFSLLLSSGIGSFVSERFFASDRRGILIAPLVALLVAIVVFGLLTPAAIHHYDSSTTPVRIAVSIAILLPLGFLMGMPFPIGMHVASFRPDTPTALLWAVNGATSVLASVLSVAISLNFGISKALWTGFVAYIVSTIALASVLRREPTGPVVLVHEARIEAEPASV